MFKPVTHVIFDMDGLLLNTEDLYTIAYQNLCKPYGKTYDWSIKIHCMGKKPREGAQYVIDTLNIPITVDEWLEKINQQIGGLFNQAQLLPGAEKLVKHLSKHKVPIALCSGSSLYAYETKTENWKELFSLFSPKVLCGSDDEVKHGKPHPDAYDITRSRFPDKPDAGRVLVFEDAPNGVASGIAANMQVVMVPDVNVPQELTKDATLVLKSLEDFKPEEFGLPPY